MVRLKFILVFFNFHLPLPMVDLGHSHQLNCVHHGLLCWTHPLPAFLSHLLAPLSLLEPLFHLFLWRWTSLLTLRIPRASECPTLINFLHLPIDSISWKHIYICLLLTVFCLCGYFHVQEFNLCSCRCTTWLIITSLNSLTKPATDLLMDRFSVGHASLSGLSSLLSTVNLPFLF